MRQLANRSSGARRSGCWGALPAALFRAPAARLRLGFFAPPDILSSSSRKRRFFAKTPAATEGGGLPTLVSLVPGWHLETLYLKYLGKQVIHNCLHIASVRFALELFHESANEFTGIGLRGHAKLSHFCFGYSFDLLARHHCREI